MPAAMRLRVSGDRQLVARLRAMSLELRDVRDAKRRVAHQTAILARRFVPVLSGRLRRSIRYVMGGPNYAYVVAGGGGIEYTEVQERGWRAHNIRATRYMERAGLAIAPQVGRIYDDEITRIIRRRGLA